MSGSSQNVEEIVAAARVIQNPADRRRFLDHACGGNLSLRQRIESLIDSPGRFDQHAAAEPIQLAGTRRTAEPAEEIAMAEVVPEVSPPVRSVSPPVIAASKPPVTPSGRPERKPGKDTDPAPTFIVRMVRSSKVQFATAIALIACILQGIALWIDLRRDDAVATEQTNITANQSSESRDIKITLNDSPNITNVVTGHDNTGVVMIENEKKSINYGEGMVASIGPGKIASGGFTGPNSERDSLVFSAKFHALTAKDGDTASLVKTCLSDVQDKSVGKKRHRKVLYTLLAIQFAGEMDNELVPEVRTTVRAYLTEAAEEQQAKQQGKTLLERTLFAAEVAEESEIALAVLQELQFTSDDVSFLMQMSDYMPKQVEKVFSQTSDPAVLDGLAALLETSDSFRVIHIFSLMGPVAEPYAWGALEDPEPRIRGAACSLLGKIGSENSIPKLEPLIKDEDAAVRKQAKDAIDQIGAADPPATE
jgi:hypothetical protein